MLKSNNTKVISQNVIYPIKYFFGLYLDNPWQAVRVARINFMMQK